MMNARKKDEEKTSAAPGSATPINEASGAEPAAPGGQITVALKGKIAGVHNTTAVHLGVQQSVLDIDVGTEEPKTLNSIRVVAPEDDLILAAVRGAEVVINIAVNIPEDDA